MSSSSDRDPSKSTVEPQHDAFTRWWIDNMGGLPSPEDRKAFYRRVEAQGFLLPEEKYLQNALADLFAGDLEHGVAPFNPHEEASAATQYGYDITKSPGFDEAVRLYELGVKRAEHRKRGPSDPKGPVRARSQRKEKRLRREAKKTKKAKETRGKVRRAFPLRDEVRDRGILQEIHDFLDVDQSVRLTSHKRDLVSPLSSSPLLPASTAGRSTTHDPVICLPLWKNASLPLRAMAMGIAGGAHGAIDFTLHLGDSGIVYGMGVGEMQFAARLYRRIKDALTKRCPAAGYAAPPFLFMVEQGEDERPHLHGIILAPRSTRHRAHLRKTLCKAVGTDWKPTPRDNDQVDLGSLYEPAGWVQYMTKYCALTKSKLGDNIFASSRALTQSGKAWYEHIRASRGLLLPGKAVAIR